jgi:hypothetical protein
MGDTAMTQPNLFVKIAVVTSSVLLVAACVGYRAGAFNWITADKPSTVGERKSKPSDEPASQDNKPAETPSTPDLSIMSGSKSAIFIVTPPGGSSTQYPTIEQPSPTIMSSSKSIAPVINLPGTKPTQPPATPPAPAPEAKPKPPTIMPGTKSSFAPVIPIERLEDLLRGVDPAPSQPPPPSK